VIKEEAGPDVTAWSGATFAAALVANDLIDEYRLRQGPATEYAPAGAVAEDG
jgi:hypothetical protein